MLEEVLEASDCPQMDLLEEALLALVRSPAQSPNLTLARSLTRPQCREEVPWEGVLLVEGHGVDLEFDFEPDLEPESDLDHLVQISKIENISHNTN